MFEDKEAVFLLLLILTFIGFVLLILWIIKAVGQWILFRKANQPG